MRTSIIGPEGSGKTVLIAMLSRYVATARTELVLEPLDYLSSQYVVDALNSLEKGDWPPSTREGVPKVVKWRFGHRAKAAHEIELMDSAGQDLRRILLEDMVDSLTADQKETRKALDGSKVLIYVIDLGGFLGTRELGVLNENAWLLKTFLTRREWRSKQRMVVLSKAELYEDMLATPSDTKDEASRIRELVKRHLPKNYTLDHLVDEATDVGYHAVTSVATKTTVDSEGSPIWTPRIPLESFGMGRLVDALVIGLTSDFQRSLKRVRIKLRTVVLRCKAKGKTSGAKEATATDEFVGGQNQGHLSSVGGARTAVRPFSFSALLLMMLGSLLGFVLGAGLGGTFGAILGAVCGGIFGGSHRLRNSISRALEKKL